METSVITTIISTGGAVIVGLGGMWISTNQIGRRLDTLETQLGKRIDDVAHRMDRLEDRFSAFQEVVNGKFRDLDTEIGKLLDKLK
jgi:predicted RNA-binding protein with PIN domain